MLGLKTHFSSRFLIAGLILGAFATTAIADDDDDPPARVARLNYLSGVVTMRPAYSDDWMNAEVNRPFTSGDSLYTDVDGRAELHTDIGALRVGPDASLNFSELTDREIRLRLNDGDIHLRVHHLGLDETYEIETPNSTITILRDGLYRIRVDAISGITFLVVREGTAEVNAAGHAATINPGHSIMLNGSNPEFDIAHAPGEDDFDRWCHQRDDHEAHMVSARYVPPTLIGYEDLDDNGSWEPHADYGPVWYPRAVPAGWAPYRFGHWVWIKPWGWTWMDEASWGFAPFHYGRWVMVNGRWGWCPGPAAVAPNAPPARPHYAPALVAWVGGPHVGVSIAVGGAALAWVALGVGELYTPPYHCSPHYFNNVNVNNTRVVNNVNITNVYQTVYVNKTVYNTTYVHMSSPNAVVAVPQAALASGQSVHQQAIVLKKEDIQTMKPATVQQAFVAPPPTAPAASNKPVAHPQGAAAAPSSRPAPTAAQVKPVAAPAPQPQAPPKPSAPAPAPAVAAAPAKPASPPPPQPQPAPKPPVPAPAAAVVKVENKPAPAEAKQVTTPPPAQPHPLAAVEASAPAKPAAPPVPPPKPQVKPVTHEYPQAAPKPAPPKAEPPHEEKKEEKGKKDDKHKDEHKERKPD